MDWYPWYFTLYEQDTMHLNPYQDGCYRRLIDHYMKTRAPLPDSDAALARIIGDSLENWNLLAAEVVRQFFKPKGGKLFHNRCDRELHYQDKKTKHLSESGKKGAEARIAKSNENKDLPSTPSATLKPPLSHCLSTGQDRTIQEEKRKNIKKEKELADKPDDIPEQVWVDFLKLRKKKNAPLTVTALNGIAKEAQKSRMSLQEAIETCCSRGWAGFKAEWINSDHGGGKMSKNMENLMEIHENGW